MHRSGGFTAAPLADTDFDRALVRLLGTGARP